MSDQNTILPDILTDKTNIFILSTVIPSKTFETQGSALRKCTYMQPCYVFFNEILMPENRSYLLTTYFAWLLVCFFACLLACFPACLPACLLAYWSTIFKIGVISAIFNSFGKFFCMITCSFHIFVRYFRGLFQDFGWCSFV